MRLTFKWDRPALCEAKRRKLCRLHRTMSPTIYDSSLLTQRRKMRVEAGDFQRRIQGSPAQTGYAPRLGIYDQSVIQTLRTGNMPFYKKKDTGCVEVSNGCPCAPLVSVPCCQSDF